MYLEGVASSIFATKVEVACVLSIKPEVDGMPILVVEEEMLKEVVTFWASLI